MKNILSLILIACLTFTGCAGKRGTMSPSREGTPVTTLITHDKAPNTHDNALEVQEKFKQSVYALYRGLIVPELYKAKEWAIKTKDWIVTHKEATAVSIAAIAALAVLFSGGKGVNSELKKLNKGIEDAGKVIKETANKLEELELENNVVKKSLDFAAYEIQRLESVEKRQADLIQQQGHSINILELNNSLAYPEFPKAYVNAETQNGNILPPPPPLPRCNSNPDLTLFNFKPLETKWDYSRPVNLAPTQFLKKKQFDFVHCQDEVNIEPERKDAEVNANIPDVETAADNLDTIKFLSDLNAELITEIITPKPKPVLKAVMTDSGDIPEVPQSDKEKQLQFTIFDRGTQILKLQDDVSNLKKAVKDAEQETAKAKEQKDKFYMADQQKIGQIKLMETNIYELQAKVKEKEGAIANQKIEIDTLKESVDTLKTINEQLSASQGYKQPKEAAVPPKAETVKKKRKHKKDDKSGTPPPANPAS